MAAVARNMLDLPHRMERHQQIIAGIVGRKVRLAFTRACIFYWENCKEFAICFVELSRLWYSRYPELHPFKDGYEIAYEKELE